MTSDSLSRTERASLCDLLDEVGPDAPTLCEGWNSRDLTAHLVIREARPDASIGIVLKPMEAWTERVQASAAKRPYADLVEAVRTGPPMLSFFALPGVDERANTMEYFVHHEDVRRAQPDWTPRELPEQTRSDVWKWLKGSSKMLFRSAPMKVVLQPTDVPDFEIGVKAPPAGSIVLRGPVAELTMHAFGRDATTEVDILGDPIDVAAYGQARRGV